MSKRKITKKQERLKIVAQFLKSGQTRGNWCKAQGIAASTFSKWIHEYEKELKQTKFIELSAQTRMQAKATQGSEEKEPMHNDKSVMIEIGPCKCHITEQAALTFMMKLMEGYAHDV